MNLISIKEYKVIPMGGSFHKTISKDQEGGAPKIKVVGRHGRVDARLMGMLICSVASRLLGQGRLGVDLANVPMFGNFINALGLRGFYNSLLMLY